MSYFFSATHLPDPSNFDVHSGMLMGPAVFPSQIQDPSMRLSPLKCPTTFKLFLPPHLFPHQNLWGLNPFVRPISQPCAVYYYCLLKRIK